MSVRAFFCIAIHSETKQMKENHQIAELLDRAATNDSSAVGQLMMLHRARVRKMLSIRMTNDLATRVDPSDVVQETIMEATRLLPQYLSHRRICFYPWLRDLAIRRLIQLHRRHVLAAKRSIKREAAQLAWLPDESKVELAGRLVHSGTSPSGRIQQQELLHRVQNALQELPESEREILVLKYLEELTAQEIAEILGTTERTVWRRHGRAIERIGLILSEGTE